MIRSYDTATTVDGAPMLYPDVDSGEAQSTDLDSADSGRLENGVMQRIVVRRGVRTFPFQYALLDGEDLTYLVGLVRGKDSFSFSWVDADGARQTVQAYCAKHSVTALGGGLYRNLKFNIIEC